MVAVARLTRTALGLPATHGQRTEGRPADRSLVVRDDALFRAATRRTLRAAIGLAGVTVTGAAALNAVGMTILIPERQAQVVVINGLEAAIGLGAAAAAVGRWRLPPLPIAFVLALSTVVAVLHLLVFVPESRATSLMLLALIPPAVALFLAWSAALHAAWLLAAATALLAFTVSGAGSTVPAAEWVGIWLVLGLSGFASLVGCVGASSLRRRTFELHVQARRARAQAVAREEELAHLNGELARMTQIDPLTGLGNRLRLNDELAMAGARSSRHGTACAIVLLDLDRFKAYNDALGHVAGDAALQSVAAALAAGVRATDSVCRFGGEEFVVVMPDETLEGAAEAAERLRLAVESLGLRYPTPTGSRPLTVSAGVASLGQWAARDPDELVRAADAALYRAKRGGRNRTMVMSPRSDQADAGSTDRQAFPASAVER
jgi:diguanylate cyclase (GGDEF)-like protein